MILGLGLRVEAVETVIVQSYLNATTVNTVSYGELSGTWSKSGANSTATGVTNFPASRISTAGTPTFKLIPHLTTLGGQYTLELTFTSSTIPTDTIVNITQSGCSGLPATTTAFQGTGFNTWKMVGTLTLIGTNTDPVITFTWASGTPPSFSARFYADAFRFTNIPTVPGIVTQPKSITNAIRGGYATFSVSASAAAPLNYYWYFNGTNVASGTSSTYTVGSPNDQSQLQLSSAGTYSVMASNASGTVTSSNVTMTVTNAPLTTNMTLLWRAAVGDANYPFLNNDTGSAKQRGMAYNPANDHLLVVSRNINANGDIWVLDAGTGAVLHQMDTTAIPAAVAPVTFSLNSIGVADDGKVYVCSLTTGGAGFVLYSWDSDDATGGPTTLYSAGELASGSSAKTGLRWGDTMDVRGSGTGTQIIVGAQTNGPVAIFTTTDGVSFTPTIITNDATAEVTRLGVAFGRGNTYWSRQFGGTTNVNSVVMRFMSFDLATGSGKTLRTYGTNEIVASGTGSAYDPVTGLLAMDSCRDVPDNLRLYDVENLKGTPIWLDTEFYATDNLNISGTAAVDFGKNRTYSLDSNNGITVTTNRFTVTPVAITAQPSSVTNASGTAATLSVGTTGYPRTFQWLKNGVPIANETNGYIAFPSVQGTDAGSYSVIVSNSVTHNAVTSTIATLSVSPTIFAQPVGQAINQGDPLSLSVTADGQSFLGYQWRKDGANLVGATTSAYTVGTAQVSDAGSYLVVLTNAAGSLTSSVAVVNVIIPSNTGSGDGLTGDYYSNQLKTFTNAATLTRIDAAVDFDFGTGSPDATISTNSFSVRWTGQVQPLYSQGYTFYVRSDDGARLWVDGKLIIDHWVNQSATEWFNTNAVSLVADQKYTIVLEYYENTSSASVQLNWSSPSQVKGVIPQSQLYSTLPLPVIEFQPTPTNVFAVIGSNVTFTATATANAATPLSYQWYFNGTSLIPGATTNAMTVTNAQISNSGNYNVRVSDGTTTVVSSNAVLTVGTAPTILTQPTNLVVLQGDTASFSVGASGTAPLSYQWKKVNANITGATNSALTLLNAQGTDTSTYKVTVTNSFGSVTSSNAQLIVRQNVGTTFNGTNLVVNWSGTAVLQTSTNVDGPYLDITNAPNPYSTNVLISPRTFFRLKN